MLGLLFSFVGWRYIPGAITGFLLTQFHTNIYRPILRQDIPPVKSPLYNKHRRYMYALVMFGYACWTFREAATSIGANYYERLGVSPTADDAALKSAFRAFAKKYHPDRAGPQAEPMFMEIRNAYEALKDPVRRFGYNRFGTKALNWEQCTTYNDYISHGLYQSLAMYVVSICALFFWNKIAPRDLAFWNYIILSLTFTYELLLILGPSSIAPSDIPLSSVLFSDPASPSRAGIFAWIWPSRVAYQHINFIKSLSVLLTSALYQVLPAFFPSTPETLDPWALEAFVNMVSTNVRTIDRDVSTLIQTELHSCNNDSASATLIKGGVFSVPPCQPTDQVMNQLTREMENMVLERALLTPGGPVRSACERAIEKHTKLEEISSIQGLESSESSMTVRPGYSRARTLSLP